MRRRGWYGRPMMRPMVGRRPRLFFGGMWLFYGGGFFLLLLLLMLIIR